MLSDATRRKYKLKVKSDNLDAFAPLLESLAAKDELNEVMKNRVEKAVQLVDEELPLYPNGFTKGADLGTLAADNAERDAAALDADAAEYSVAGRIMALRSFGKAAFIQVQDASGRLQVHVARDEIGPEAYALFKKFDVGDIVGVTGRLFRTKTDELTIKASAIRLLTKSMRPLPEKYHGLKDVETRYRQRYVDLMVNERTRDIFVKRTRIVRELRRFFDTQGFLEVETPMMQPIPGGATAKPFSTHHKALDMHLFMRIAPELYLKRLLVGGFEKVYEVNRNFRNEGISTQHNPEFTMCEFYWAYATFEELMDLTEQLCAHIAQEVCGSTEVPYQGEMIDLTPGTWTRMPFLESLTTLGGLDKEVVNDFDKASALAKKSGEKVLDSDKLGKVQAKLFDIFVEPKLIQPTFIYHYPTDISPLSRKNDADASITDRFELFIAGREMANAFSELNDPVDQRMRFLDQVAEKEAGDEEAHYMDDDYVRALEYGMPPAAGEGIGIDRLVMLLTDSASIREVILFPLLRPEA